MPCPAENNCAFWLFKDRDNFFYSAESLLDFDVLDGDGREQVWEHISISIIKLQPYSTYFSNISIIRCIR